MWMNEGAGWWIAFGGISMVIFWGGLIALIVWGISKLSGRGSTTSKPEALDIAKERYAKGRFPGKSSSR